MRRDDPATWRIPGAWVGLKAIREEPLYRSLDSPPLRAALDAVLGESAWREPRDWGGFLVTMADCAPEEWTLPARGWHVDAHFTRDPDARFGIRVFTFLDAVAPRSGGTLVVRGSHRLVRRYVAAMTAEERESGYARLRDRFCASDPWLAELTSGDAAAPGRVERFLGASHAIEGVEVGVEELTGSPGDVVLAHPWILHVTAPHAGDRPRMMLAKEVVAREPVARA